MVVDAIRLSGKSDIVEKDYELIEKELNLF